MDRRNIVQTLRINGLLKGVKPCVVFLKKNSGDIYLNGMATFVMSMKKDKLYFQRLSTFFHDLKPKDDFELDLSRFESYIHVSRSYYNILCLYAKNRKFIEINYDKGTPDTFPTEENIGRIIEELNNLGIKERKNNE